ncbi:MAG: guanylate kinase [Chitinophagales bacterium]|nr:guanylate kinase [Chitinophagales bacterium]MDW8419860.1 guanylate kinase [Chitinophagales bacterium]
MAGHRFTRVVIPPRKLVVITAPSGAGKTSIVKKLLEQIPYLGFSVSCTTRPRREGEQHGREYYFISVDEFKRKIAAGEFAEYEEVYPGMFYGTLKSEIERIWNNRKVALFDIDVKGAHNLKKMYGDDCLTIFISPPSRESLENRLRNRHTENAKTLKQRLQRAIEELAMAPQFDKQVVNADFDTAFMRVKNHITNFLKPAETHIH